MSQSRYARHTSSEGLICGVGRAAAETPTDIVSMLACTEGQARIFCDGLPWWLHACGMLAHLMLPPEQCSRLEAMTP